MQDEQKLIKFRDSMSKHYDIPEIEQVKKDIGFAQELNTWEKEAVKKKRTFRIGKWYIGWF